MQSILKIKSISYTTLIAISLTVASCTFDSPTIDESARYDKTPTSSDTQGKTEEHRPTSNPTVKSPPSSEPLRCISPEDCPTKNDICCLNRTVWQGSDRLPATIRDAQKGYCAATCNATAVTKHLNDPVATCTQKTESIACDVITKKEICSYITDVQLDGTGKKQSVGRCVALDQIQCDTDNDCGPHAYCVMSWKGRVDNASTRSNVQFDGPFKGKCKREIHPRDLCVLENSKIPLPNTLTQSTFQGELKGLPYCIPSTQDIPTTSTSFNGGPRYGRVAFLCTTNSQCTGVDGSYLCYGKNIATAKKPLNIGTCQPRPSVCVASLSATWDSTSCLNEGLHCCRAYGSEGEKNATDDAWYCIDTTTSDSDCAPYDQFRLSSVPAKHHYGKCSTSASNDGDTCKKIYGSEFECKSYLAPYFNSVCQKN